MKNNDDGIAYTLDRIEAQKHRIIDDNQFTKQQGYTKYVNFYTYIRPHYILPVRYGTQKTVTDMKQINMIPGYSLLGYQQQAINSIQFRYDTGEKSAMIISGTGTGKSYLILGLINLFKLKTCVVVPNTNIGKGLYEKFINIVDAERITAKQIDDKDPDVMIITAQSFNKVYEKINDRYDILLIDEVHYMPKKRVDQINRWKGMFVCGLTATPQRKEFGIKGFEMMFGNIYNTNKETLPVKIFRYNFNYNYSMKQIEKANEGLAPESPELYRRLYVYNDERLDHLGLIIKRLREKGFKKMMIFTDRKVHIEKIHEFLGEGYLMTGDNKSFEFKGKDEYIIIGMMQCTGVGFDVPELEVGILFMSTSWTNTIEQSVGRMRRYYGDKEYAFFVDFVDIMQFAGSKKKVLGWYARNRIYKQKGFEVLDFKEL